MICFANYTKYALVLSANLCHKTLDNTDSHCSPIKHPFSSGKEDTTEKALVHQNV